MHLADKDVVNCHLARNFLISEGSHISSHAQNVIRTLSRAEWAAIAFTCMLITALAVWGYLQGTEPGKAIPGFIGAYGTGVFVLELISAILLLSRFRATQRLVFLFLGCAYGWVAIISAPQVFMLMEVSDPMLGIAHASASAAWLWNVWHLGFPIFVIIAMIFCNDGSFRIDHVDRWFFGTMAVLLLLAGSTIFLITGNFFALPSLIAEDNRFQALLSSVIGPSVILLTFVGFAITVTRGRLRDSLFIWLAVAMLASFYEGFVVIHSGERYSHGWYIARLLSLFTSLTVVIALLMESMALYRKVLQQNFKLEHLATRDELTQLANRRVFEQTLRSEFQRCMRDKVPLSLIMCDVDHFKSYNDNYGHLEGDSCLKLVSNLISNSVHRNIDLAARFGGEEFAILLPETSEEGAAYLAEGMRKRIEQTPVRLKTGELIDVTASFGVASMVPGKHSDPNGLVQAADQALYGAKDKGRNRIERYGKNWHHQQDKPAQGTSSQFFPSIKPHHIG